MPEGDSVAGHAAKLRAMFAHEQIVSVQGSAPSVRAHSKRILESTVTDVRTHGKNLIVDFSTEWSLLVHLAMNGRWRFSPAGRRVAGSARVALATSRYQAACSGAPTVEVERTPAIELKLQHLGPDLLSPEFDSGEFLRRVRLIDDQPIGEVLLNQRVVAGIGNVYKSELLYLFRTHPQTPAHELTDDTLAALSIKASRLLSVNVGPRPRSTTGEHAPGRRTWVYGREGRPCRRCGTAIAMARLGDRVTYWCPNCQPEPE